MAFLEQVNIQPMVPHVKEEGQRISWLASPEQRSNTGLLPQVFFDDGEPWLAANAYALQKYQGISGSDIKTVNSNMSHLKAYASWLEDNEVDWRHFPKKKKERCLVAFRGFLIEQREKGYLSASTVSTRMNAVITFYRWAQVYGWISKEEKWRDKTKVVRLYSSVGLIRTLAVKSSELSIPNRRKNQSILEDGLLPIDKKSRDQLLSFLKQERKVELYLIFLIGFFTGARSETIRTLRVSSLENALPDTSTTSIKRVAVGPGTGVRTKFGVNGYLLLPGPLVCELENYAFSVRRITRSSKATNENRDLLFLSERGNPYSDTSFTKLISYLRERLVSSGFLQFRELKFHQTRATFGTELMRLAMNTMSSQIDAIVFVRDAMLHKDEATTWKYIKFIEREPLKEALSDEFFNLFTGQSEGHEGLIDMVTYDDYT